MYKPQRPTNRAFFSVWVWLCYPNKIENGASQKEKTEFYTRENTRFLEDEQIPKSRIIHISKNSPTVIIRASDEEINSIKKNSLCVDVTPYLNEIPQKTTSEVILSQIGADSETGTNSRLWGNGDGLSGEGIVIGMISAERSIFEPTSPQLVPAINEGRITVIEFEIPPQRDLHPSVVLSEIIGAEIELGGITYSGVLPKCRVIFASTETEKDVFEALDMMIALGVKVVNYSAGIIGDEEYRNFDRQIDRIVEATGILFVTVSGNRRTVASAGISYSALTVGNLQTKTAPSIPARAPFCTWCKDEINCSGYSLTSSFAHKPDVVAPGVYIPYISPQNEIISSINIGTSFACPFVSGIAGQIIEQTGITSHLALKTVIAMSCDRKIVCDVNNPTLSGEPFAREKTGFGLVNAKNAVLCASEAEILNLQGDYSRNVPLTPTQTLCVGMCFNKSIERENENLSLYINAPDKTLSANRQNQNLHVLEYTTDIETVATIGTLSSDNFSYTLVIWIKKSD